MDNRTAESMPSVPMTRRTEALSAPWDWSRLVFLVAALSALVLLGLNGALVLRASLFDGILNPNVVAGAASHFGNLDHRIHDVTFALLYAPAIVGLAVQLRSPMRNVAGQIMALVPWASLGLVFLLTRYWTPFGTTFQMYATAVYGGFTLSALFLHPRGRDLVASFGRSRASRPMLALVAVAAVPLLRFAAINVGRQREVAAADIHWQLGHYGFMAAIGITVVAVGVLASLRPIGWRLTAWVAAGLAILLGVLSLMYPDADSGFSIPWAVAALGWGVSFVAVAESRPKRVVSRTLGVASRRARTSH